MHIGLREKAAKYHFVSSLGFPNSHRIMAKFINRFAFSEEHRNRILGNVPLLFTSSTDGMEQDELNKLQNLSKWKIRYGLHASSLTKYYVKMML